MGSKSWLRCSRALALLFFSFGTAFGQSNARRSETASLPAAYDATLPYRNANLPIEARVDDLLSRMTLEEKAGQLFHYTIGMGPNGTLSSAAEDTNSTDTLVGEMFLSYFNFVGLVENSTQVAEWHNRLQQRALDTRLGVPITLATDPRHTVDPNVVTSYFHGAFSAWPDALALAAIRDPAVTEGFANTLRQEYMAVGFRAALHPQIDLMTEYRWGRTSNTLGEDAGLAAELVKAYLRGFKGEGEEFGNTSVSTVTKHFPGAGPMEDGEDSHFVYGKNQTYPGNNFDYHLIPFKAAIAAGARQMMPYYSRPIGTTYDPVGFAFNKGIITDLLRNELGFEGIVVSDWGLITDSIIAGQALPARAWGVEYLSELECTAMVINAGADQFGGESRPELIVELVRSGNTTLNITEERINTSVRRLLKEKFELGLFENPFVNVEKAAQIVGRADFVALGEQAQRDSFTLLTNNNTLPLTATLETKVYIEGFNATALANRVTIVPTPEEADYALLRLHAPYEPRLGGFESRYRTGSLEFNTTEKARQAAIYSIVPTIVDIQLDRAAAIPEIAASAAALLGSYGSSAEAFVDILFGDAEPKGKLPFDMPRSTEAVAESREDVPFDTVDSIFTFGHGLRYE